MASTFAPIGKHSSEPVPVISRSSPATAEARWRLRLQGSNMDLANGLETGSRYLHLHSPDLTLSRAGSLRSSSSPLCESAILQQFFSKKIDFVYISEWCACCRGNAFITVILDSWFMAAMSPCSSRLVAQ